MKRVGGREGRVVHRSVVHPRASPSETLLSSFGNRGKGNGEGTFFKLKLCSAFHDKLQRLRDGLLV